jgi:nucleoid-associated protein YgaU
MGIFDFIKDAGSNIFSGGTMDSAELEAYLRKEFGDSVTSLKAAVQGSVARLVGVCDTLSTKEKVILVAGNVNGIESVNDDHLRIRETGEILQKKDENPVIPGVATEEVQVESTFYTIKAGDNLSKIAKEFYGDPMKYTLIFEANREVIKDPDKIYPGQKIRLPDIP